MASASSTSMPKVTHRALDLGVAKQKLDGPKVAGAPINQSSLRTTQRMRYSNLTGRPVFFCRTVARSAAYPPAATSSTLSATTSQPRSLLSIARLNMARSRTRPRFEASSESTRHASGAAAALRQSLALVPGPARIGNLYRVFESFHRSTPSLKGRHNNGPTHAIERIARNVFSGHAERWALSVLRGETDMNGKP
jgi:hypothetical protein